MSDGFPFKIDKTYRFVNLNVQKTKVMIFNKGGKHLNQYNFTYNDMKLETTNCYSYLGIIFQPSGLFNLAQSHLKDSGFRALYKIMSLVGNSVPKISQQLFDRMVKPILSYGSEIWSPYFTCNIDKKDLITWFENFDIEKANVKFCKNLLKVNRKTSHIAVRAELCIFPLGLGIMVHSLKYWVHLTKEVAKDSLVYKAYLESYKLCCLNSSWLFNIKQILSWLGREDLWENQGSLNQKSTMKNLENLL